MVRAVIALVMVLLKMVFCEKECHLRALKESKIEKSIVKC